MKQQPYFIRLFLMLLSLAALAPLVALGGPGSVNSFTKIADESGGLSLADVDFFGSSCTVVGDLDGDGIPELAVGAERDGTGGDVRGAVHILFLDESGIVKSTTKIADSSGGLSLADGDGFGSSCTAVGDLDGDGIPDLAVGAIGDNSVRGAVYILFLDATGGVKSTNKISPGSGGLLLEDARLFGSSCTVVGDLDGDGIPELAVGAEQDGTGGTNRGAVYILFLNPEGGVRFPVRIADGIGGLSLADDDLFGISCTAVGDLDGDGIPDLAVGAAGDKGDSGNPAIPQRGAVYILFLDATGGVKSNSKIADGIGGLSLVDYDTFGISCTALGDLDGDGIPELAVGASGDSVGGNQRGALYVLFLNGAGGMKSFTKIADGSGGLLLANGDVMGTSCTLVGDLDGNGLPTLAVGAIGDDTGGDRRGAVHMLEIGDLPLVVTTADDEFDTPSDSGDLAVSLREALRDAKDEGEFRTITFDPSLDGDTITLNGSDLEVVSHEVRITAASLPRGITISANGQSRIFDVGVSSSLALEGLVLKDGAVTGMSGPDNLGGALLNRGVVNLIDCYLHNNSADGSGGAIHNQASGALRMSGCTVSGNSSADSNGGGAGIFDSGESSINHCTIADNTTPGRGAGFLRSGTLKTSFAHVTIVGNEATLVGGGVHKGGATSEISFRNCIVAANTAGNVRADISSNGGTINAASANLVGSNQSVEGTFPADGEFIGTAGDPVVPGVGLLADNGGRTPTMLPLRGSIAIDPSTGASADALPTDQRGSDRVVGGIIDIGAVEAPDYAAIDVAAQAARSAQAQAQAQAAARAAQLADFSKKLKKLKKKFKNAKRKGQASKAKKLKKQIKNLTKQMRAL